MKLGTIAIFLLSAAGTAAIAMPQAPTVAPGVEDAADVDLLDEEGVCAPDAVSDPSEETSPIDEGWYRGWCSQDCSPCTRDSHCSGFQWCAPIAIC